MPNNDNVFFQDGIRWQGDGQGNFFVVNDNGHIQAQAVEVPPPMPQVMMNPDNLEPAEPLNDNALLNRIIEMQMQQERMAAMPPLRHGVRGRVVPDEAHALMAEVAGEDMDGRIIREMARVRNGVGIAGGRRNGRRNRPQMIAAAIKEGDI